MELVATSANDDNDAILPSKYGLYIKLALMIVFIVADSYLNSKMEYDDGMLLNKKSSPSSTSSNDEFLQQQIMYFGSSIILQLSIASTFFLVICSTSPFQIGVLFPFQGGIYRWYYSFTLVYMILSCVIGALRRLMLNGGEGGGDVSLWGIWYYSTLSIMHKLVAPCYYAAALRSAFALGHKMYYTKDAWVK
jgi:hypothetical protein